MKHSNNDINMKPLVIDILIFIAMICMPFYLIMGYIFPVTHLPKQPFELISPESDEPSLGPFQLGQIMQLNYPLTFRDHTRNIYGDPIRSHIEDNQHDRYENTRFATKTFLTDTYDFDVSVKSSIKVDTLLSGEIIYIEYNYQYTDTVSCKHAYGNFEQVLENRFNDSFLPQDINTGVFVEGENKLYIKPTLQTFVALSHSCSEISEGGNYISIALSFNVSATMSKLLVSSSQKPLMVYDAHMIRT